MARVADTRSKSAWVLTPSYNVPSKIKKAYAHFRLCSFSLHNTDHSDDRYRRSFEDKTSDYRTR